MKGEWNDNFWEAGEKDFSGAALRLFRYQYAHNPVYRQFAASLQAGPENVNQPEQIPFLPVSLFKTHQVKTGSYTPQAVFESSGTTGGSGSLHFIRDLSVYEESFLRGFRRVYGEPSRYCIIGLLPSYLEKGNSSLVYMTEKLIRESGHPHSGFYLHQHEQLAGLLSVLNKQGQPVFLIGVTYALLDFAAAFPQPLLHTIIVETGGMKGRRREMTRAEVHTLLKTAWDVNEIHAEYGMTELFSQAWSTGDGLFRCPPWMKVLLREEEDPLTVTTAAGRGCINIIDLANYDTCAFIATDDAGRLRADGSFEVLGRRDGSDLRGCSLLVL